MSKAATWEEISRLRAERARRKAPPEKARQERLTWRGPPEKARLERLAWKGSPGKAYPRLDVVHVLLPSLLSPVRVLLWPSRPYCARFASPALAVPTLFFSFRLSAFSVTSANRCELRAPRRYNEDLGGVPITFSEMRLADPTGRIFRDHPHVHLHVLANFVVFAPAVGKPLCTARAHARVGRSRRQLIPVCEHVYRRSRDGDADGARPHWTARQRRLQRVDPGQQDPARVCGQRRGRRSQPPCARDHRAGHRGGRRHHLHGHRVRLGWAWGEGVGVGGRGRGLGRARAGGHERARAGAGPELGLEKLISRGRSKNATRLETVNAILTISGSLLPEDGAVDLNAGTPARKVRTGGSAWAPFVRRSWPLGPPFLVAHGPSSSLTPYFVVLALALALLFLNRPLHDQKCRCRASTASRHSTQPAPSSAPSGSRAHSPLSLIAVSQGPSGEAPRAGRRRGRRRRRGCAGHAARQIATTKRASAAPMSAGPCVKCSPRLQALFCLYSRKTHTYSTQTVARPTGTRLTVFGTRGEPGRCSRTLR